MQEVVKQVTVRGLYDVLIKKQKKSVSLEDFIHWLELRFLASPTLELRFHDLDTPDVDTVYVLKHSEIAKAITNPEVPSESRAGKGE